MLNFWEELLHLPNYNWSNFEANPTVDLREKINQPKVQRLHYHYLLHTTPFSYFHNLSFNTSHTQKTNNPSLVSLHDPLSLFPLSNESFEILAPINGFLILQGPMRFWEWIAIQLKLGWESLGPMKHKRDSILQSKRMTILMTNGIRRSIPPLSWISWWSLLSLILIFSIRWPSHLTSSS